MNIILITLIIISEIHALLTPESFLYSYAKAGVFSTEAETLFQNTNIEYTVKYGTLLVTKKSKNETVSPT